MKTQTIQRCRSWLWSALLFALMQPAGAGVVPNGEISSAIPKSEVICVGTIKSVGELGHGLFDSGTGYTADAQVESAEVSVEAVLSGSLPGTHLHFLYPAPPSPPRMSSNYRHYPQVVAGERALFFLRRSPRPQDGGSEAFALYSPFALPAPLVPIGNASLEGVLAPATPLRRVILTLVRALEVPDGAIRLECLKRLGEVGYLLNAKPDGDRFDYAVTDRLVFGEPFSTPQSAATDLEGFVKSRVLPTVLMQTMNGSTEVRERAILTLGRLQDVDVIPALARIADKPSKPGETEEAASILCFYRNPAATRPLVGVLGDSNPNVRAHAAAALRGLGDSAAVPSLLEHLDDPDPDARYYIVTALYTATNTPEYPGTILFSDDADKYVSVMKKWAAEHQDRVAALREQFIAPLPTKAAP